MHGTTVGKKEWDFCLSGVNGKGENVQELAAVGQTHLTPSVGMIK
jgi:hypothetical protein